MKYIYNPLKKYYNECRLFKRKLYLIIVAVQNNFLYEPFFKRNILCNQGSR